MSMSRIDRENLAAMTNSLVNGTPIGLNLSAGTLQTRPSAAAAADAPTTVANGSSVIDPKPGSKFAAPHEEDFCATPIPISNHRNVDAGGNARAAAAAPAQRPAAANPGARYSVSDRVIAPKPGSKFAATAEADECGAAPVPMDMHEEQTASRARAARPVTVTDDFTLPNGSNVLEPKPSTKFAAPEPEEEFIPVPVSAMMDSHGDYIGRSAAAPFQPQTTRTNTRSSVSVSDFDNIVQPKPGSKFAAA